MLLNNVQYMLEILAWQNANEGLKKSKQSPRPQPYVPEFMGGNAGKDAEQHDIDDIKNLLSLPRE